MGRKVVPVKTKEGTQEIRARALGLAPRIRTALLLVDGVKSMEELERLMDAAGVTPGALQMLLDKGLIRIPEPEPQPQAQAVQPLDVPSITLTDAAHTILEKDGKPGSELPPIAPTILEPSMIEAAKVEAPAEPVKAEPVPAKAEPVKKEPAKVTPIKAAPAKVAPVEVKPILMEPFKVEPYKAEPIKVATAEAAPQQEKTETQIARPPVIAAPLEVATLLELETILGEATKMEVATILGVATMLELTPTQMRAPNTAAKAPPPVEPVRLTPLAQAERDLQAMRQEAEPKPVIPAAVLRSNLMAARAHLAAALDEYLEIDGYLLKQKVMACENREELQALVPQLAAAFIKKMEKTAAKRLLSTAEAMLDR